MSEPIPGLVIPQQVAMRQSDDELHNETVATFSFAGKPGVRLTDMVQRIGLDRYLGLGAPDATPLSIFGATSPRFLLLVGIPPIRLKKNFTES